MKDELLFYDAYEEFYKMAETSAIFRGEVMLIKMRHFIANNALMLENV